MSSHHPKSAYAELLSLREWMLSQKTIYVGDVHTEIDRRLATADRGEAKPETMAQLAAKVFNEPIRDDRLSSKPAYQGFMDNYNPLTATPLECAVYELCRRALGRDQ